MIKIISTAKKSNPSYLSKISKPTLKHNKNANIEVRTCLIDEIRSINNLKKSSEIEEGKNSKSLQELPLGIKFTVDELTKKLQTKSGCQFLSSGALTFI